MKPRIREVIVVEGALRQKHTFAGGGCLRGGGWGALPCSTTGKRWLPPGAGRKRGLILLTDPDGAGFVIRSRLKSCLPPDKIKQAYVPDVYGKGGGRKREKEGKLGVEGMKPEVLVECLRRAGATFEGRTRPGRRRG